MSFDQEPDPPLHGECALEIRRLEAEVGRLREALEKIYRYRSDEPDWNMVMAIAGDIIEPMEAKPSEAHK